MHELHRALLQAGLGVLAKHPELLARRSAQENTAQAPSAVSAGYEKFGCNAADESLVVHGHLNGLAKGLGGFGVLRESKKRLDKAADAAVAAGDIDTAAKLRTISYKLPAIRDAEKAKEVASELEPLLEKTWKLGVQCGLGKKSGASNIESAPTAIKEIEASSALRKRAEELAIDVRAGKITRDQAIEVLRTERSQDSTLQNSTPHIHSPS